MFWSFVPPSEIRAKQSGPIVPRSGIHSKRFGPLLLLLGFVPSILVLLFLVLGFVAYLLVPYRPFAPRSRIRFQSFTVCEIRHQRFFSSFLVLRCIAIVPSSSPGIRYPEQNYLSVFVLWTVSKFGGDTPLSAPAHCMYVFDFRKE